MKSLDDLINTVQSGLEARLLKESSEGAEQYARILKDLEMARLMRSLHDNKVESMISMFLESARCKK